MSLTEPPGSTFYSPNVDRLEERVSLTFSSAIPIPSDLDQLTFDMWKYDTTHYKHFFISMLQRLGLIESLSLRLTDVQRFVEVVHSSYRENHFHSFVHAFTVCQMMYSFIVLENGTTGLLTKLEQFCLLVSALCHDIDHPGVSNAYLARAESPLAVLYNDRSILENHHSSCTWRLLTHKSIHLLRNVTDDMRREMRSHILCLIMSTDMSLHFDFIREMESIRGAGIDMDEKSHRRVLMQLLMKCADISNEARPWSVSKVWADRLTEEFAAQSELEKKNGHPLTPWMIKGKTPLHTTQINFIESCILPVFQELAQVLPAFHIYVEKLHAAKSTWAEMATAEK